MTYPLRTTARMTGSSNPHYSWMDTDNLKVWIEKASTFHPWDIEVYGRLGQTNICADYSLGKPSICNWITENADEGAFTNPSAYKRQFTPFPVMPRYYTLGDVVDVDTPGPNSSARTLNCELDGEPTRTLGKTHNHIFTVSPNPNWGGSVGTALTIERDYYYNFSGGVYQQQEIYSLVRPFGRVQWTHANWNGSIYVIDNTTNSTTQTAGGAQAPVFPCYGTTPNWIGGVPGAGGNAPTP